MLGYLPILLGAATGALYMRERRIRLNVERLGAAALETLLDAIDANSPATGAHVRRVASYSLILADAAGLDERCCRDIERVALFHDIGKIDIAFSDIVDEATTLTPAEREAVRSHPRRGAIVLRPLETFYPGLSRGVLAHHERWDGTGYPRNLRGRRIPLSARVVAIADTFDAITHSRSYRRGKSASIATKKIEEGRGTQFDPELTDLFLTPPVLEQIAESLKAAMSPRRVSDKRRDPTARWETPDINFRWRSPAPVPQRMDR